MFILAATFTPAFPQICVFENIVRLSFQINQRAIDNNCFYNPPLLIMAILKTLLILLSLCCILYFSLIKFQLFCFIENVQNGKFKLENPGCLERDNCGMYEGDHVDGIPNGYGKITYPWGSVYEGYWKDGHYDGHGKITAGLQPKAMVYEGEFKKGQRSGIFEETSNDGSRIFVTNYVDGIPHQTYIKLDETANADRRKCEDKHTGKN